MIQLPDYWKCRSERPSRVLVLCPHPDDFDVAGVTLRHLFQLGAEIRVLVAPTFSGILDGFFGGDDRAPSQLQKIQTREQEQRASLQFFGLAEGAYHFLPPLIDLDENGEFADTEANADLIFESIAKSQPDSLFLPHPNDANPAHAAMHRCAVQALRSLGYACQLFQQVDPKTRAAQVNAYKPLDDEEMAWKSQLLLHHKTQNHRNLAQRGITIAERILQSNEKAAQSNHLPCTHAECFEILMFPEA